MNMYEQENEEEALFWTKVPELLLDANASEQLLQHLHRIEQQKPQWLKMGMWVIYWQKNASS